jgi:hypothetical protein
LKSDKTELPHFPTFHNVLAGLATVPRFLLPSRQKNTYFRSGSKAIAKTGSAKKLEYKYLAVLGHSEKIKIKAD